MEEKLSVKINAPEILEKELAARARKKQYGIIVLSSVTDPYLHAEKEYALTRKLLKIIADYQFPVHIITKSDLVTRDFDLLKKIRETALLPEDLIPRMPHPVIITYSFSTTDPQVSHIFEPGAVSPENRLEALKKSLEAGFFSGVSLMPLIPYVSDTKEQMEIMFRIFQATGVRYLFPATLTLHGNGNTDSKTLMLRAIARYYPHLTEKYRAFFLENNEMPGYYQEAFYQKTKELCKLYGIPHHILPETF